MDNGVDILNQIKEIQNRSLALKKISKEIYDETIVRMKDLQEYKEKNNSIQTILLEQKRINSTLEANNHSLDRQLMIWETLLKNKKECLENQTLLLEKDQSDIFSARSAYCDSVSKFLNQYDESYSCVPSSHMYNSTEWKSFNDQVSSLEDEMRILNESLSEKKCTRRDLQSIEEIQKQEESKYQKLIEEKKQTLKNLISRVKSLKLEKRKHQLNNTIENLYHQNSSDNLSSAQNENFDQTIKSAYFSEPRISDSKSKPSNKSYNLYTQKSNESMTASISLADKSFSSSLQNFNDTLKVKRCKISPQSGEIKGKFKPKQPLLAKKLMR